MKPSSKNDRSEYRAAASRLRALLGQGVLLEGSLCRVKTKAGAHWQLTRKERGKTTTLYIPDREVEAVRGATERWKQARSLLKELGEAARRMVRVQVGKRSGCRTPPSDDLPPQRPNPQRPPGKRQGSSDGSGAS